jgi:hypothetical protein
MGTVLLFGVVIAYVDRYGYGYGAVSTAQVILFLLLASGAVALGGLAEGRPWALVAWLCVTIALPLAHAMGLDELSGFWPWLMVPLVAHGVMVAAGLGRAPDQSVPVA